MRLNFPQKPPFDLNLSATPTAATGWVVCVCVWVRVCLSCFKCTGHDTDSPGQHIRRLTVSGRFSPEQMLALNSRQLSLLLFVVCQNHICSCHYRAPNNGRGLNIGRAWRIIMLRLTLARAVARAPSINARAHPLAPSPLSCRLSYRARAFWRYSSKQKLTALPLTYLDRNGR